MTLFDNLIGGYLSGIVFATTLLGATTIQAYWYFARFPKDPSWNKLLVIFLIGAQFLNLGCMMKTMYGLLVQSLGRAFTRNPWSGSSYLLVNAVSSVLVHFFFVGRIRKLTKIRWLPATIAVASLSMLGFAVEVSVNGFRSRGNLVSAKPRFDITAWCTCQVVVDVLIASSMVGLLYRSRTGFLRTDRALTLLGIYAVNTGLIPSILAIVIEVAYGVGVPGGIQFMYLFDCISLGGVYTFTLLANLHARSRVQSYLNPRSGEAIGDQSIHLSRIPKRVARDWFSFDVIQVSPYQYNDEREDAADDRTSDDPPMGNLSTV